jgi:hypothetical protein
LSASRHNPLPKRPIHRTPRDIFLSSCNAVPTLGSSIPGDFKPEAIFLDFDRDCDRSVAMGISEAALFARRKKSPCSLAPITDASATPGVAQNGIHAHDYYLTKRECRDSVI